jgi:hypothetical protein
MKFSNSDYLKFCEFRKSAYGNTKVKVGELFCAYFKLDDEYLFTLKDNVDAILYFSRFYMECYS